MNNVLFADTLTDSRPSHHHQESQTDSKFKQPFAEHGQSSGELTLRIARPSERLAAISHLFKNPVGVARRRMLNWIISLAKNHPKLLSGLLVAGRTSEIEAAIWLYQLPGRQLNVWLPCFSRSIGETDQLNFLQQVSDRIAKSPSDLAWSTVKPDAAASISQLQFLGLKEVAELTRMFWQVSETKPVTNHNLSFVNYEHAKHQRRLVDILNRCEKDSLDCRKLHGTRKTEDMLEGHCFRESLTPSNWLILNEGGKDIGCLLLSRHNTQPEFEVVYLSIVPEARGRRLGSAMIHHAQKICIESNAKRIILTCDGCNLPAWNLYRTCGFEPDGTWKLFAKELTNEPLNR
ncbi:GNAT family N-acetyltransferase [Thalassoglobus sp. JC818]|uniref:GNAT family N-acetyltransferase n=1 Tax=Thalassoglobus sp. JC818 TaxID=3232136 RepID=UPI003459CD06